MSLTPKNSFNLTNLNSSQEAYKAIEGYLRNIDNKNTRVNTESTLKQYFEFKPKEPLEDMFSMERLQDFRDHLVHKKLSPNTIRARFSLIKGLVSMLVHYDIVQKNHIEFVKLPRVTKIKSTKAITPREIRLYFETVANDIKTPTGFAFYAGINLLFKLGLRVNELASLRWKNIKFRQDEVELEFIAKGSKQRSIRLPEDIVEMLASYKAFFEGQTGLKLTSNDLIVQMQYDRYKTKQKSPLTATPFNRKIKKYAKMAGVEEFSSHTARASMITSLLNKDISLRDVANLVGHSSIRTTMKYDNGREDKGKAILEKLDY